MIDFNAWLSAQTALALNPEPDLPDGVDEIGGRYFVNCCCCEQRCDVTEFMSEAAEIDFTDWHGGCGPRCCP